MSYRYTAYNFQLLDIYNWKLIFQYALVALDPLCNHEQPYIISGGQNISKFDVTQADSRKQKAANCSNKPEDEREVTWRPSKNLKDPWRPSTTERC